ncbi:DEAD/DEAH box helicase [Robertmurraya massiliosenegalensis]|uniref:DEAD/DEAH box helicase n=1 Tax=Robertmurraya TaxID=2837507 RepID=UPI0039A6A04F
MSHLEALHPAAIEHTKSKVWEDVYRYLGSKERVPSIEQFLVERKNYLAQIWLNVWLNKASNQIPRREKMEWLENLGYEVEGVDRKFINHSFRQEIREYQPFDVWSWVQERFDDVEEWNEIYKKAREQFLAEEEKKLSQEEQMKLWQKIDAIVDESLTDNYQLFYLHTRYYIATNLVKIIRTQSKYEKLELFSLEIPLRNIGHFHAGDYSTLNTFLEELTGDLKKTRYKGRYLYQYETYHTIFEQFVRESVYDKVPAFIFGEIDEKFLNGAKRKSAKSIKLAEIEELLSEELPEITLDFFNLIKEEYVDDLLTLAAVPFDPDRHEQILMDDLAQRDKRKEEELAALRRKEEEEERRIDEIFGQEYLPQLGSNIRYVLHIGDTNTGKTHHALEQMKNGASGLYLAPLRLLALEVYDKLNADGVPCTLKTGEEEKLTVDAKHFSCTVEMFHESEYFDVVVIDEAQMIADKDRGFSWYKAITKANAREVHIVGSKSLKEIVCELLGNANIEIREYSRDIPLQVEKRLFSLEHTKKGDALVCFSRKRVLETASRLQNSGFTVSVIYGSMPPETRKKEMQRFIDGETKVIVSTDAIGMGLNLPIRRIVFLESEKFDGTKRRRLTSQEVKQIAGRAGRKGLYDVGKVAFSSDIKVMKNLLKMEDQPVASFAIAPTASVFERFQKYYRELEIFFELWGKFESPQGTEKASLSQERELYHVIRGTEVEARLSMMDMYGFLHLPFSTKDQGLIHQWRDTMFAIIEGAELPEPVIKKRNLEEQELSYKAIGLHLLFLYRLDKRLEAHYWEKVREELSDAVHESIKTEVKKMKKKCRSCGKTLPWEHSFPICDFCHERRYDRW